MVYQCDLLDGSPGVLVLDIAKCVDHRYGDLHAVIFVDCLARMLKVVVVCSNDMSSNKSRRGGERLLSEFCCLSSITAVLQRTCSVNMQLEVHKLAMRRQL